VDYRNNKRRVFVKHCLFVPTRLSDPVYKSWSNVMVTVKNKMFGMIKKVSTHGRHMRSLKALYLIAHKL